MTPSEARNLLNRVVLALDDATALGLGQAIVAAVERTDGQGHLTMAIDAADDLVAHLEAVLSLGQSITPRPGSRTGRLVQSYRTVRPR